jgi:hypothetical protein
MKTIKKILFYLFFGLSFCVRGQAIGNYVSNGGFEKISPSVGSPSASDWRSIDSAQFFGYTLTELLPPFNIPLSGYAYQWPKGGHNYFISSFYFNSNFSGRGYPLNRLKNTLIAGKTYCVKFYCNVTNQSSYGIDGIGAYFGNSQLDTITHCTQPLTYITPQIQNPTGNVITDTLNWIPITGTFVANGTEKYLVLGNFKNDASTDTILINPAHLPTLFCDFLLDDVSCIELNLPAYAGKDTTIYLGDSLFIGRQSDFAIDPGCIWYKLPNMTTSLDTISGIWVKPTTTSTYVVRQVLDCSPLKWDTIVVTISTNYVGLDKLQSLSDDINLFPNPTSGNLSISGFSGSDISSFCISNCLGQNVLNGDFIQKNNLFNIETSELESGLYQIHLKTPYGIVTKKFVKTN